jgi:hypothetical protein
MFCKPQCILVAEKVQYYTSCVQWWHSSALIILLLYSNYKSWTYWCQLWTIKFFITMLYIMVIKGKMHLELWNKHNVVMYLTPLPSWLWQSLWIIFLVVTKPKLFSDIFMWLIVRWDCNNGTCYTYCNIATNRGVLASHKFLLFRASEVIIILLQISYLINAQSFNSMTPFDLIVVTIMFLLPHYIHCTSFISWLYKLKFYLWKCIQWVLISKCLMMLLWIW